MWSVIPSSKHRPAYPQFSYPCCLPSRVPPPAPSGGGLTLGPKEREHEPMSTPQIQAEMPQGNPIDLMEQIAVQNEWLFDRAGEDEMHLSFPGQTEDH